MSRGTEFLDFIIEKLNTRQQELKKTVLEEQKDIESMNDYYWENYTEMDQYGYENFDNQQALLGRINASNETRKSLNRVNRMLDSPFFGSVDFLYDGEDEEEIFYIGIGNFAERPGSVPYIFDWRAPVSGLFYDYDKGKASYEAPGGVMSGEILSKWQYKIRRGKMVYEFESDVKIDDDILKQELGANSDTALKNIVRTIQKEQNAIIRNTKDKILVIQGVAGSGKTSVALHRIAYLLYHDREHLKSSNVLILSPNGIFSDYISHILPELGEENIREMSFDLFAYRELKGIAGDCEDRYHYIEACMKRDGCADAGFSWKQSRDYVRAVEGFLIELEDRLVDFRNVEFKGVSWKAEDILKLFYYKFMTVPLLDRMHAVREYLVDEFETLKGKNISDQEEEYLKEQFDKMYVTRDVYEIYNWLLEDYGYKTLPDVPVSQRVLGYEDVYPVLYLKYRLFARTGKKEIRHLVIDEMQDYSYLQYVILAHLFQCKMTILGDRAQTLDAAPHDVLTFLPEIFGKGIRRIEMNRSYRNTAEIARFASKISPNTNVEYLERHGHKVQEYEGLTREEMLEEILKEVRVGEEEYETAAVLAMTGQEAREIYEALRAHCDRISYLDRDSSSFQRGITVTTWYLAKGLEFDQVFIAGGDQGNPFYDQYLYISATRALHELYVF